MKKLTMLSAGLACAALAAAADAGGAAAAPEPGTTDPNAAPAPDATAANAQAAAASAKAQAATFKEPKEEPATAEYRITANFHDTTTGKLRKKGRKVRATEARAAQLVAAKVINPEPLDDDAEDEGEEGDEDGADSNLNNPNAVAPVGVDGPVDEAVLRVIGADDDVTKVTDGDRTLSTDKLPPIVTGGRGGKAK